ncbi:MAG: hypothetical protein KIH67_002925 [Candidatus Moranbacteria bacterium]|nr:hypothetical protein [Candidatus Moranbacteria bacterium]
MYTFSRKQRVLAGLLLFGQLFFVGTLPAQALFGVSIPSPSKVATDLEKRYHLDLENVQDQGELFNVGQNKQPVPEVTLSFSPTDPRPGEKITARAFPVYFSNKEEALYYGWYLKRSGCDLDSSPSQAKRTLCDRDGDRRITVEDWKIEAVRVQVQNGYDSTQTNYSSDSDDDGYKARFGGDNKTNTPNYCYYHDNQSGINYEMADAGNIDFDCPNGTTPICMIPIQEVESGDIDASTTSNSTSGSSSTGGDTTATSNTTGSASATGNTFELSESTCTIAGLPACSNSGQATCSVGFPKCVANPETDSTGSCGTTLSTCSSDTTRSVSPYCKHLFPEGAGRTSGDGSFGAEEERFWGTDPNDPDTADSGSKDEASVVGFGKTTFTWNYNTGDQVGVAVEGTSMIPTKHDNASLMIMWAFPKQDCPLSVVENTGVYTESIKGYSVEIETADVDLNKCLERNLVDPAQGGQATNLDVAVSATPREPLNDESGDGSGDVVVVSGVVSNGNKNINNTLFDWNVEISNNIQFSGGIGPTANITKDLQDAGLLRATKGNALDTVSLAMNIPRTRSVGGRPLSSYLVNDIGYLRFSLKASENFENGVLRKGKSDVIIKFVSTGRKIVATRVTPVLVGDKMRVQMDQAGIICNNDALDRSLCRVIKNEIVGLRIDDTDLSNFQWRINDQPLVCTETNVSPDCSDGEQNAINFFPVSGQVGDTYTVTLSANDVTSGKTVTLSRAFRVVEPLINVISSDEAVAWPKLLGQYRDITEQATGCPDGLCNDFSKNILQAAAGSNVTLQAEFVPSFVGTTAEREWYVNGQLTGESDIDKINFDITGAVGTLTQVQIFARIVQSDDLRRALYDIWNISPLDSPEISFSKEMQIEVQDAGSVAGQGGALKYFAAIVSYVPASVVFAFRIVLSAILILFATAFLMGALPQEPALASRRIKED